MKVAGYVFISMCMSVVIAEPPIGEGYPSSRSFDHDAHHNTDLQRSLSEEYGPPSSRNSLSAGYSSRAQNPRAYTAPTARVSFTQRFPSSASQGRARTLAQDYVTPESSISQANARSLSQYGAPAARSLSSEYGAPDAGLSLEFGSPVIAARSNQHSSNLRSAPLGKTSQAFTPSTRSQFQAESSYNPTKFNDFGASRSGPSTTYAAPSRLSSSYGVPSARDSDSYSQEHNSISPAYGAPSQRLSDTYGAPSARLSQEYGAPSSRSQLKTGAIASSYASARSSPASTYLPSSRDSMPSQQYGVPQDTQGYDEARARALEELLNQAPANYDFSYQIEDQESGGDFGHSETRLEDRAEGSYFVVLPDGTKQTVQYSADEDGFKPRVSVEPLGGYDQNAQELARDQGPY